MHLTAYMKLVEHAWIRKALITLAKRLLRGTFSYILAVPPCVDLLEIVYS